MGWLSARLKALGEQRAVFATWSDIMTFRRVRDGRETAPEVSLRIRPLGGLPLVMRTHSTDLTVLWDTFHHGFHLPPRPLPADAVILDLGANAGYTAAHLAHLHPRCRLVAVEMDAANHALAARNLAPFAPRVSLVQAAVWWQPGQVIYGQDGEGEWGFHVMEPRPDDATPRQTAQARTVPDILAQFNLSRVDYVKMDIEGAEALVLANDAAWLDQVGALVIETHPLFNPQATMERCAELLAPHGFTCRLDTPLREHVTAVRG